MQSAADANKVVVEIRTDGKPLRYCQPVQALVAECLQHFYKLGLLAIFPSTECLMSAASYLCVRPLEWDKRRA